MKYLLFPVLTCSIFFNGCSHRNRAEKGPHNPREIRSLASTDQNYFVMSNKDELYRFDFELSSYQTIEIPKAAKDNLSPASLIASGNHLYLVANSLYYSGNSGDSWVEVKLPPHDTYMKCISTDKHGHILVGYIDGVWYAESPLDSFQQIEESGVMDCSLSGSNIVLSRKGQREIRSLDRATVKTRIPEYGITVSDDESTYFISARAGLFSKLNFSGNLEDLSALQPSAPIYSLDIDERYLVFTLQDKIVWVDKSTWETKSVPSQGARGLTLHKGIAMFANNQDLILMSPEGIQKVKSFDSVGLESAYLR